MRLAQISISGILVVKPSTPQQGEGPLSLDSDGGVFMIKISLLKKVPPQFY